LTTDGLLGRRYMARFIDSQCIGLLIVVVLRLAGAPSNQSSLLALCIVLILWIGYGALLESSPWQATLGKRFGDCATAVPYIKLSTTAPRKLGWPPRRRLPSFASANSRV
jgi:hypothetical protein